MTNVSSTGNGQSQNLLFGAIGLILGISIPLELFFIVVGVFANDVWLSCKQNPTTTEQNTFEDDAEYANTDDETVEMAPNTQTQTYSTAAPPAFDAQPPPATAGYAVTVPIARSGTKSLSGELLALKELLDSGVLTEEEFTQAKAQLLNRGNL